VARAIVERLQQNAVRAFLDVDSLDQGKFDTRLLDTIADTPAFVVLLSEGSLDRCKDEDDWLRREVRHALQTRRNIVPTLVPQFKMPRVEDLPREIAELARYNGILYQHDLFDGVIARLLKYLKK
jgi:hypothetical protein